MKLQRKTPAIEHRATLMRSLRADDVGAIAQAALEAEKEQELEKNGPKVSAEVLTQSVDAKLGKSLRRKSL